MKRKGVQEEYPIDIVLPWVDGSDPEWQKCKNENLKGIAEEDNRDERFREWDTLKYVFRSIETNTPWVRKVHFITWGHLPKWLNTNCNKLHIVNHKDYIPEQFLPTFSSHAIELNLHRIKDLSEHFIYINDDMYFMNHMKPDVFFRNGIPCAEGGVNFRDESDSVFNGILYEDRKIINRNFSSKKVFTKHFFEFVNPKYALRDNLKSLLLIPCAVSYFPPFIYYHGPNAFLKSTFESVWQKEEASLSRVCSHKFRQYDDVNQYLMLWWQWCEGNMSPQQMKKRLRYVDVAKNDEFIKYVILSEEYDMICVNDASISEFEHKKALINTAFEKRFPEKSSFEL